LSETLDERSLSTHCGLTALPVVGQAIDAC
jgi:hypothetical protein